MLQYDALAGQVPVDVRYSLRRQLGMHQSNLVFCVDVIVVVA